MKIYEIGTGYTPIPAAISAATEIVVEELTKALQKQGVPVEIVDIAADSREENALPIREVKVPKQFSGTDIQLGIMHKLKRVVYSVALAGELKKILKQTRETVVLHFHNQYNLFFFLKLTPEKLRRKCLIAYTNHSGIWRLDWQEIEGTIRKRYFQEAECMKQADLVFLLNEETKHNIMKHLGVAQDRIVVIGNGVNTDVYRPLTEAEKQTAKTKWNLENCDVILQVGSVNENKGQLRTAQNLLPLLKQRPDLVFAYAGGIVDEAYQQSVLQLAKEHHLEAQIRYLGMLSPGEELNELYSTALATVCASRFEGFSLALVESLACGVPVLTEESAPFYLGEGCAVYPAEALSETVRKLTHNNGSYTALCAAARSNALHNYSWNKIVEDYRTAFEDRMKNYG